MKESTVFDELKKIKMAVLQKAIFLRIIFIAEAGAASEWKVGACQDELGSKGAHLANIY